MNDENHLSSLPLMAIKEIPQPHENAARIVALVKDAGRVVGYQLSNGQSISKEDGVRLAREGAIQGVGISERNGNEYLKSLPDGTENNNLSHLPAISSI